MKKIMCLAILLFSSTAFSADLIVYVSKDVGEIEYRIILRSSVAGFGYNEDDKVFKIYLSNGSFIPTKVDNNKKAKNIIAKVMDDQDKSLIELDLP